MSVVNKDKSKSKSKTLALRLLGEKRKEKLHFDKISYEEGCDAGDISDPGKDFREHYKLTAEISFGNLQLTFYFGCSKKIIDGGNKGTWKTKMWKRLMVARSAIIELIILHEMALLGNSHQIPTIYKQALDLRDVLAEKLSGGRPGELVDYIFGCKPSLVDSLLVDSPIRVHRLMSHYGTLYFSASFWNTPGWSTTPTPQAPHLDKNWERVPYYPVFISFDRACEANNPDKLCVFFEQGEIEMCIYLDSSANYREALGLLGPVDLWNYKIVRRLIEHPDLFHAIWVCAHQLQEEMIGLNEFELCSDFRTHKFSPELLQKTNDLSGEIMKKALLPPKPMQLILQNSELKEWMGDRLYLREERDGVPNQIKFYFCVFVEGFSFELAFYIPVLKKKEDA